MVVINYSSMIMDRQRLLQRLETEGQQVLQYFNQLEQQDWASHIYAEGELWTIHQILAHFVATEQAFQWLIDNIVKGGAGSPEGFELDSFNQEQVKSLEPHSRQELLDLFTTERNKTIEQASRYTSADLRKEGRHPWFGQMSTTSLLRLLYQHNKLHLRDIRRVLSTKPTPPT
jgi:uncharacterized damage-inducible protein DinB